MLSNCLNPARSAPFRYLREGRIFHLEIPSTGETPAWPAAANTSGYAHRAALRLP